MLPITTTPLHLRYGPKTIFMFYDAISGVYLPNINCQYDCNLAILNKQNGNNPMETK